MANQCLRGVERAPKANSWHHGLAGRQIEAEGGAERTESRPLMLVSTFMLIQDIRSIRMEGWLGPE